MSSPAPLAAAANGAAPLESVPEFVQRTKQAALDHLAGKTPGSNVLLIMGNTAGDLDSASSAIGLSYLLTHFPQAHTLPLAPGTVIVPLLQSSASDGKLRPENVAALAVSSLSLEAPLHIEELRDASGAPLSLDSSAELSPARGTLLGLVDHASLSSSWRSSLATPPAEAERKVVLVVDHHVDEGAHKEATLRILRGPAWGEGKMPVGSCSSLVADLFTEQLSALKEGQEGVRQLCDLLLSALLIDTDNVRPPPRGKSAPEDESSLSLLLRLSSFASASTASAALQLALSLAPAAVKSASSSALPKPEADSLGGQQTAAYWGALIAAKIAVGDLSSRDLLRRDYKESLIEPDAPSAAPKMRVGFSSVPMGLASWVGRERGDKSVAWQAWWGALGAWMDERNLDGAVVGTSFRDEEAAHRRELVIAFTARSVPSAQLPAFFAAARDALKDDAYFANPADGLVLKKWGHRLPSGAREPVVGGIDDEGKIVSAAARVTYAAVYRQKNTKASRKQVVPAVVAAVKQALKAL